MTRVLITIDTELWAPGEFRPDPGKAREMAARYVYGTTSSGDFGIGYLMRALSAEGLKAVFFVEALHTVCFGDEVLAEIVERVRAGGHEIGLHVHSEWLARAAPSPDHPSPLPGRSYLNLRHFDEGGQSWMIERALRSFAACGVTEVRAFRAGNYGADQSTLRAIARHGIRVDSSYNFPYLSSHCGIEAPWPLRYPTRLEGVVEVPITFIRDYPGHARHLQIAAVSFEEMRSALEEAHRQRWPVVTLVGHSFELLRRGPGPLTVDPILRRRFDKLVHYLGRNKDRFDVCGFEQLPSDDLLLPTTHTSGDDLRGSPRHTAGRWTEQLLRRIDARSRRAIASRA